MFSKTSSASPRGRGRHKIVIGKDTRAFRLHARKRDFVRHPFDGVDVLFIGPLPTPGVAYAHAPCVPTRASSSPPRTIRMRTTASNFSAPTATSSTTKFEDRIENLVFQRLRSRTSVPRPTAIGKAVRIDDALGRYIEICQGLVSARALTLEGVRIVLELRPHGAAYKSTPLRAARNSARKSSCTATSPTALNINCDCGSMHPEAVCRKVVAHRAHLGIAHDGDADRVLLLR